MFPRCLSRNISRSFRIPLNILQINFNSASGGRFDLEVTTFQMSVMFCWNDRPTDRLTFESIRLATELPDLELRRTLFVSFINFKKSKIWKKTYTGILHCSERKGNRKERKTLSGKRQIYISYYEFWVFCKSVINWSKVNDSKKASYGIRKGSQINMTKWF